MIVGLAGQLERWEADPAISRVRIDSSVPDIFSAGGDLAAFAAGDESGLDYQREFLRQEYALLAAISNSRLQTVCELDGLAMGGGLGLAMACSTRVIKSGARFGMPELAIGLIPDVGASGFLLQPPYGQGLAMALTGYHATATDAVCWGWGRASSDEPLVLSNADATSAALVVAAHLAGESENVFHWYSQLAGLPGSFPVEWDGLAFAGRASALAAAVCWELMRHEATKSLPYEARLEVELALAGRLTASGEFLRGITGFLNRRSPEFAYGTLALPVNSEFVVELAVAWVSEALRVEQSGTPWRGLL